MSTTGMPMVAAVGLGLAVVWGWSAVAIMEMKSVTEQALVVAAMALCCYAAGFLAGRCWKSKE
jgi:hypothetical protein